MATPPQGGVPLLINPGQPGPMRPEEFGSASVANQTTFGWDKVAPPSSLYIQRDDVLEIQVISTFSNESVNVNTRMLLAPFPEGGQPSGLPTPPAPSTRPGSNTIQTSSQTFKCTNALGNNTFTIQLTEGYLLSLAVSANNAQLRGQTFIRAILVRGGVALISQFFGLIADYSTANATAMWPYGRYINPVEGPGFLHSVQVANPGAGADWTMLVAGQVRRRITSLNAVFTASGAAGNRGITLVADDGANIYFIGTAIVNVTTGQVVNVIGTTGNPQTGVIATNLFLPLPNPFFLPFGHRLRAVTTGLLAGDQWSAIWLGVEDWIEF